MDRLLLKPQEAAETLGISRAKMYQLLGENRIPSIKVGASVRVPVDSLREWITRQVEQGAVASGR